MRLIDELRRRHVFRVAAAYLVGAWLVLQVGDVAADGLFLPDWFMPLLFVLAGLGLPVAIVLAWVFQWTPEGLVRDRERPAGTTAGESSSRAIDRFIVVALVAVIVVLAIERFWFAQRHSETTEAFRERSVAVLPFENFSADPGNAYFADGIAEEILNLLSAVQELEVSSRTSSFVYRDSELPIPDIARALDVRYLLEGSVRRAGERVRITAQLIDAQTDRHMWSRTFDRELNDIFAVQDEIAGAVGDALQVQLLGGRGQAITAQVIDPTAYERFLEARFLMRQRNSAALARAEAMLASVIEQEPDFARALALQAEVLVLRSTVDGAAGQLDAARVRALTERALALDPDLGSAYLIRGQLKWTQRDTLGALADTRSAVTLSPEEPRPHHWLAFILGSSGHLERSLASIEEAIRLEPDNANAHGWRAIMLATQGRMDDALAATRRQSDLGNPLGDVLAFSFLIGDDPQAAERRLDAAVATGFGRAEQLRFLLDYANGSPMDAEALDARLAGSQTVLAHQAAAAMLELGYYELLLERLESFEAADWGTLPPIVWKAEYAGFRRDPRFVHHLQRLGIEALWSELGMPADCIRQADATACGQQDGPGSDPGAG